MNPDGLIAAIVSSLRGRLMLSLAALLLFGGLATAVYQTELSRRDWYDVREQTMQAQAEALANAVDRRPDAPLDALSPHWREVYERSGSGFGFTLYDRFLRSGTSSPSLAGRILPIGALPSPGERTTALRFDGPEAEPLMTVRLAGGGHAVVSRDSGWSEALVESIEHEQGETVALFIVFGGMAVGMIAIILPWTLRPLSRASAQAAAIGPQSIDRRIDADGLPRELQPLVHGFNGALDRLAAAYGAHRRITANAAHELRTPLAVLSLRLQHVRMGETPDWPAIITDLARIQRLIDQLLDLARKQAGGSDESERGTVNLSRVVREAAAIVLPLAEQKGRTLDVDIPEPVTLADGRGDDLRDMVRNLIENALLHGEGDVLVGLRRKGADAIRLTVADQGMRPDEGDALFEEFRKGVASTSGSGLGLAIVRQVADLHRGEARFLAEPTTTIEVVLKD